MKTTRSLLIAGMAALCCVSCSSIGRESRQKWASHPDFVSGDDSLLEAIYMNRSEDGGAALWSIISDRREEGNAVQLRSGGKRKLEISLLDHGRPVASVHRTLTRKGRYWSIGSRFQTRGIPPLLWGITDNEVGLAIDRDGNLNTSHPTGGLGFVGPIPLMGAGSGHNISTIHRRER